MDDSCVGGLSPDRLDHLTAVLDQSPVRLAVLFGSTTRPNTESSDIDLAVEFQRLRPGDDGYTTTYLDLVRNLEAELDADIDVLDVHSADDRFLAIILEDGVLIYGPSERTQELAERVRDAYPTTAEARDRVAAAVSRLKEVTG